nr:MAG TPA: hypothetical protein [Caudoviricetes sp.]DAT09201.1 MAG TPA: hypothetical protein [Caudoviricetes sp.]
MINTVKQNKFITKWGISTAIYSISCINLS